MLQNIMSKITRKIPVDFSYVFLFDIISKIFTVTITIILIRIMSPVQYANIVKFSTLSGLIHGIFGGGIALSFIRYSTELLSRGQKNTVGLHALSSLLIVILSVLALLTIPLLRVAYNTSTIVVVYATIFGFILSLINMNQAYFQSMEQYIKSGIINNLRNVFIFILLIVTIIFVGEIQAINIFPVYVIAGLLAFIFGLVWIYKGVETKDLKRDYNSFKSMLGDSFWIVIYLILLNLFNQMDVVMLSNMLKDEDVAMYGIAFKYYSLLLTLLPSIKAVLRVRTSKKEYVDSREHRKDFTVLWLKKTGIIVVPACFLIILTSGIFMPILNGHQYDSSINAFRILMIGVGISYVFASNVGIMMAANKHKMLCVLALVSLIFNTITNWLFIPIWGINAAAATTVISHAILNVSATFFILFDKGK